MFEATFTILGGEGRARMSVEMSGPGFKSAVAFVNQYGGTTDTAANTESAGFYTILKWRVDGEGM